MDAEETDIVVVGMGPGWEDAARRLAEAGLHVTGVEARLVGGESPYWGCVPSKMMIRAPLAGGIWDEATSSWDDERMRGRGVGDR